MKILLFSTLYPNAVMPHHGIFVENRLRHLLASGKVTARVMAPVPWFPLTAGMFGAYGVFARVPRTETRHDTPILHPRYPLIPGIGMSLAPALLYLAMRPEVRRIIAAGFDFDLIDAHYFYPDGVAAVMLGRHFGKPVTITARGTDINLIPAHRIPRKQIVWAAGRASGMIAVCQALKDEMVKIGIDGTGIRVLRNGVDLDLFRPLDRERERERRDMDGPSLVSVGHLIPRKGHDLVVRALALLPGFRLQIVGDGPEEPRLRKLARTEGVADRIAFLGRQTHEALPQILSANDALVLASSREGWANVLLEAMACGTPVVASDVWGTPEVVAAPAAGALMRERTPEALATAVRGLFANLPDRDATRAYAEQFSWDATTQGQLELFGRILSDEPGQPPTRDS